MAYDYQMGGGYIEGETPEEYEARRRREAELQAQAEAPPPGEASGVIQPAAPGVNLGDLAGRYINNRLDQAGQNINRAVTAVTNPVQTIQQNLGMPTEQAANTEVQTQTVKTYGDGSQEHTVKTQVPPPAPVVPQPQPVAQMPQPTQTQPQPPMQTAPVAQPAVAQTAMPQLTAGGGVPETPAMEPLPQPGPGVQVAGPVNPAAVTQPAPAVQAQPTTQPSTAPQWQQDLADANGNVDRLIELANNKSYPAEARTVAKEKLQEAFASDRRRQEAEQTVLKAAQGDAKAQNELLRSLRPVTGKAAEKEEGSYIKAYLYARLGLTDLAKEEQEKILGKTKFSQAILDGQHYATETDREGRIVAARDAEGQLVPVATVAKLNAEGAKAGTHAFGFTGGSLTIPAGQPNAGQEYRQRTNAITGKIENVITTGLDAGKLYTGLPGFEKRVETNAAVKLNDAYIDFQTKPTIAMATQMLELAGKVDNGKNGAINNAMAEIQRRSPGIFQQVQPLAATITAQGAAAPGGAPAPAPAPAVRPGAVTTPPTATTPQVGGGTSLLQQQEQQKANIEVGKELAVAGGKPPAEARGKNEAKDINNQRYSNETYGLIKPISDAIKQSTGSGLGTKVDQLAGVFGVGTTGAQAKAQLDVLGYNLVSNVPRFEGAQSDRDVALYERAAGDIANSEKPINVRLAALNTIVQMLKKYDKAGANDWSFGTARPGGEIKIISREKVQ